MTSGEGGLIEVLGGSEVKPNIRKIESIYDRDTGKLRKGTTPDLIIRLIYDACDWLTPADFPTVRAWALLEMQVSSLYEVTLSPEAVERNQSNIPEILKASTEVRNIRRLQNELADRLLLHPRARKEHDLDSGEGGGEDGDVL